MLRDLDFLETSVSSSPLCFLMFQSNPLLIFARLKRDVSWEQIWSKRGCDIDVNEVVWQVLQNLFTKKQPNKHLWIVLFTMWLKLAKTAVIPLCRNPSQSCLEVKKTIPFRTWSNCVDSIAASLFVLNWLSWQIVSDSIRWQDPNNNTDTETRCLV